MHTGICSSSKKFAVFIGYPASELPIREESDKKPSPTGGLVACFNGPGQVVLT